MNNENIIITECNNKTVDDSPDVITVPSRKMSSGSAAMRLAMTIPFAAAAMGMFACGGGYSSYDERHDPSREKTAEDLKHIELAKQKRERKAKKRTP